MQEIKGQPRKTLDEIRAVLDGVSFMDRTFRLLPKGDGFLLQIEYMEADIDNPADPKPVLQRARKWYVSPFSTETEIVETAFKAVKTSMMHVVKEHFAYKGRRVYSPHFQVDARIRMCDEGSFDGRAAPPKEKLGG